MKHLLPLVLAGLLGGTPPLHGRILFEAHHTLRQGALVVMDADGTHRTRVAGAASGMVVIATRGAYAYSRLDGRGEHVVVVDADGKHAFGPGRPAAFSPDGRTLVVQEQDGTCVLRDTHTGRVQHTFPATMGFFGWSPGGLLFAQPSGDLLVTQPDGSGEHTVAHPVGDLEAAWSPDGAWIAYETQPTQVRVVRADGSDDHAVGPGGRDGLVWSPNGSDLAFASPAGRLVIASPDGTATTTGATVAQLGSWSPDGTEFAFDAGGREAGIAVVSTRTFTVRSVSSMSGAVSWFPDGRTLLVRAGGDGFALAVTAGKTKPQRLFRHAGSATFRDDGRLIVQLIVISIQQIAAVSPAGGKVHYLRHTQGGREPAASPDGTKLAFVTPSGAIAVASADGSRSHVIVRRGTAFASPSWSPDSRYIAYADGDAIDVVAAGGGRPRRIADAEGPWTVAWSPDGKRIAFGDAPGDSDSADIVVVDRDGTHRHLLLHGKAGLNWGGVAWSPDGRTIAVARRSDAGGDPDGNADLYLVDVRTHREHEIGLDLSDPSFSPDGKQIAVANDDGTIDVLGLAHTRGVGTVAQGSHPSWSR